jgi:hypothetical protein
MFSDSERSVNASFLEPSGYQSQDRIKNPQKHFSFLRGIQILLHIIKGVKNRADIG